MTNPDTPAHSRTLITSAIQTALSSIQQRPGRHQIQLSDLNTGTSSAAYAATIISSEIQRSCGPVTTEQPTGRTTEFTLWLLKKTINLNAHGNIENVTWDLQAGAWQ